MAGGRAWLPGGRAGRVPALGGGPRGLRHCLPDRLAGLRGDRRQAPARDRRVPRRGRHGPALREALRRDRRGNPARGPRHRLLACDPARARALAALPLQPRPGSGRDRVRGQHHAPRAAGEAALLRRARDRGRDRPGLGSLQGADAGDRRAGVRQVHPACRRHKAPAGAGRRAHPVLRGADRIRLRRHRRRRRADVVRRDPQTFSELRRRAAVEPQAAAHGGDRGRGARPRDGRGGGARRRLRHRGVLDDAHHRRRRDRAPDAGRVSGGGAGGTGRRADRRHDAGGDASAAAQPGRRAHGAPRMACLRRTASRRRCSRARRRPGPRRSAPRWRRPATTSRHPPGARAARGRSERTATGGSSPAAKGVFHDEEGMP